MTYRCKIQNVINTEMVALTSTFFSTPMIWYILTSENHLKAGGDDPTINQKGNRLIIQPLTRQY